MIKNVIFCDFDEVLVIEADRYNSDNTIRNGIDSLKNPKIVLLNHLLEINNTEAYFVPISTWGDELADNKEIFQQFLSENNLNNLKIFEKERYINEFNSNRAEEINAFIRKYNVENYIILDDEFSKEYDSLGLNHITTEKNIGINSPDIIEKLNNIFKKWN